MLGSHSRRVLTGILAAREGLPIKTSGVTSQALFPAAARLRFQLMINIEKEDLTTSFGVLTTGKLDLPILVGRSGGLFN